MLCLSLSVWGVGSRVWRSRELERRQGRDRKAVQQMGMHGLEGRLASQQRAERETSYLASQQRGERERDRHAGFGGASGITAEGGERERDEQQRGVGGVAQVAGMGAEERGKREARAGAGWQDRATCFVSLCSYVSCIGELAAECGEVEGAANARRSLSSYVQGLREPLASQQNIGERETSCLAADGHAEIGGASGIATEAGERDGWSNKRAAQERGRRGIGRARRSRETWEESDEGRGEMLEVHRTKEFEARVGTQVRRRGVGKRVG
ncbi:hypothetical protein L7F22_001899 [Adiantum nelumboides]|nr:hypothetical protein [Adiantum nelumboides]